jgi:hypothetical protein
MAFAPIALFIYRRPEHTRRTLESLRACKELAASPLYVYCDGPKTPEALESVREARQVALALAPAATTFVESEANQGLARSIITGVSDLTARYGKVIVVEDDLEVAPAFLRFLNEGLDRYANDDRVMQISGYQFPLVPPLAAQPLFLPFITSWGWGTWARAWKHFASDAAGYTALKTDSALRRRFDLDDSYPYFEMLENQRHGRVDSWAIRWYLSVFMRDALALYPGQSLVKNTGFDSSGTHGNRGAGFAGQANDAIATGEWPEVAIDRESQRRVFAFVAEHARRDWATRAQDFIAIRAKAVLSNPKLPPSLRALGTRLLARVSAFRNPR